MTQGLLWPYAQALRESRKPAALIRCNLHLQQMPRPLHEFLPIPNSESSLLDCSALGRTVRELEGEYGARKSHTPMSFNRLASLLIAEGGLHERENRRADAARIYVEVIRLGNEVIRGGLRSAGIACAAGGYDCLAKLVPKLNGREARGVLDALERVNNPHPTPADLERNQRRLGREALSTIRSCMNSS